MKKDSSRLPLFSDDQFRRLAVEKGYLTAAQVSECAQVQSRTVGRTVKPLEQIAEEREFISRSEVKDLYKGRPKRKKLPTIGGYEIKGTLGEGGLGVVHLALQTRMNRDVALKVLHPRWVEDDEFRKRFLLEARLVGKMSHPNLIQVFDIGVHEGTYYFSMELVEGKNLQQLVEEEGALEIDDVLGIAIQVCRALEYIGTHGLVHRDIKPSNIIVNRDRIAKLGDFGFVKSKYDKDLAKADYVLGTPDYIAPEQAMGKETDLRTDIYSLGATLYHCITGIPPYDGTESRVIRKHIKADFPSPKEIIPGISDDLCHVLERMMAKHPADRYGSYEELINDLSLIQLGKSPNTLRVEAGKSSIMRTLDLREQQTQHLQIQRRKLSQEIDVLRSRVRNQSMAIILLAALAAGLALYVLLR